VDEHCDKDAAIIEFGAVPLLLTASLARLGYSITGVDIAPERFSRAINDLALEVVRCNIETERLPFHDSQFDVALFNELFEHLRINPIFTMREVHRILKPGGLLFLSTPNLRSLAGLANFLLRNRCYSCESDPYDEFSELEGLGHMGHVREYTTREITEFLGRIGFEVLSRHLWQALGGRALPPRVSLASIRHLHRRQAAAGVSHLPP
jgi:SAM-dependent methyltransferase